MTKTKVSKKKSASKASVMKKNKAAFLAGLLFLKLHYWVCLLTL
jgi:hypothetical protein